MEKQEVYLFIDSFNLAVKRSMHCLMKYANALVSAAEIHGNPHGVSFFGNKTTISAKFQTNTTAAFKKIKEGKKELKFYRSKKDADARLLKTVEDSINNMKSCVIFCVSSD